MWSSRRKSTSRAGHPKGADKKVALQGPLDKKLNSTRYLDELKKHLSFACAGLPSRSSG